MLLHSSQFVILYTDRTGSTFCRSALESNPHIGHIEHEYFVGKRIRSGGPILTNHHVGFKIHLPELINSGRLHELKCRKIVMYRHNKLSQFISYRLAYQNSIWHHEPYPDTKIHIDIGKCVRQIRIWTDIENAVRQMDNCLWLEYGEAISGKRFPEIQEFLGVPTVKLRPTTVKQANRPNIGYVSNVDELLKSELAGWV